MRGKVTASVIGLWGLRILMAALFFGAAFMKLSSQPQMVEEFESVGLGQWFRYLTGALELIGAIGLIVPRSSAFAAVLLLMVDAGAFVAQVTILHMDWIHTIVIGVILGALIYLQRHAFGRAGSPALEGL